MLTLVDKATDDLTTYTVTDLTIEGLYVRATLSPVASAVPAGGCVGKSLWFYFGPEAPQPQLRDRYRITIERL